MRYYCSVINRIKKSQGTNINQCSVREEDKTRRKSQPVRMTNRFVLNFLVTFFFKKKSDAPRSGIKDKLVYEMEVFGRLLSVWYLNFNEFLPDNK